MLNTKDKILRSAIELFSVKGFNASSTLEIAQRAGVAEITVFRHFKTKKDLLLAVLDQFMDTLGKEVIINPISDILNENGDKSQKEILKMMIKDRIQLIEKNSDLVWIVITEMKYHADLKEKIATTFSENVFTLISKALRQDEDNNSINPINIEANIRAFMGTVISIVLHYKVLNDILPPSRTMDEAIDDGVEILLYGILNR